jgi:hypothetical protein
MVGNFCREIRVKYSHYRVLGGQNYRLPRKRPQKMSHKISFFGSLCAGGKMLNFIVIGHTFATIYNHTTQGTPKGSVKHWIECLLG